MPLSASEIIAQGKYLNDDFDPKTLTNNQLLGILSHHGVPYPTNAKKASLIALFNDAIVGDIERWREERVMIDGSQASDRGIVDGMTGELVGEPESPDPPQRRSTRRSASRQSIEPSEQEAPPTRRATAGRATNGRSARTRQPPAIIEVDDSDSEEEVRPVRPVRKNKAKEPEPESRRTSSKFGEDSGWEDNNVFQSGPEDTPPKSRRTSINPRKPRSSESPLRGEAVAGPSSIPSPVPPPPPPVSRSKLGRSSVLAPPPPLPPATPAPPPRSSRQGGTMSPTRDPVAVLADEVDQEDFRNEELGEAEVGYGEEEGDEDEEPDESELAAQQAQEVEEQNGLISRSMSDLTPKSSISSLVKSEGSRSSVTTAAGRFIFTLIVVTLFTALLAWKSESASIGYCDARSDTNPFLEGLRQRRAQTHECNAKLVSQGPDEPETRLVDGVACALEPLNPIPPPNSCTPCPKRATCVHHIMQCDGAFIPKPHPANAPFPFKLDKIFDGLPWFGSVAFPPTCIEDRRRIANLIAMERQVEDWLAKIKGEKTCEGQLETGGGDAKAWGVHYDEVRARVLPRLKKITSDLDKREQMCAEAIDHLEKQGLVISEVDSSGNRYVGALRMQLTAYCHVRIGARGLWNASQRYVFALVFMALSALYGRWRLSASRFEARRVAELVQLALETLRSHELAHHTDPVTVPHGFISSSHLRDLVLQNEHSGKARRRLWEKVEKVVEGNANVRSSIEEVNGDETRAWRWTGMITGPSPRKVQWGGKEESPDEANEVDGL